MPATAKEVVTITVPIADCGLDHVVVTDWGRPGAVLPLLIAQPPNGAAHPRPLGSHADLRKLPPDLSTSWSASGSLPPTEITSMRCGVGSGGIVSLIGAVDSCRISNMPRGDAANNILNDYAQPIELSGAGEVKDGKPYVHCGLSGDGDAALAGQLHWARVETWFVNVHVMPT
jgi:hypothetical protein